MTINVSFKGFADAMRRMPEALHKATVNGLVECAMRLQAQTQAEIDTTMPHKPVDAGAYAAGFGVRRRSDGAIFFNTTPQGQWIEIGRRAGPISREGMQHLRDWVRRKKLYLDAIPHTMVRAEKERANAFVSAIGAVRGNRMKETSVSVIHAHAVRKAAEDMAIESVAFAIAQKIIKTGYAPRFPVARAIKHAEEPMRRILSRAVKGAKP
jgi:hypothetical protein